MTKPLKDWTKAIADLDVMGADQVQETYADMLATAHDLDYKVPDKLLIETEDPAVLRKVILPLHDGIKQHHAAMAAAGTKARSEKPAPKKQPTKPAKVAAQKAKKSETETMATTAKKTVKAPAAKKTAKKAAAAKPAKKAAKKAASNNARTALLDREATIKVVKKENPAREGTTRYARIGEALKWNGKKVGDYLDKSKDARPDTLRYMQDVLGLIKIGK